MYTFLVVRNQVVTIENTSFDIYQQLCNNHLDALQCPCSRVSISYEAFLNVTFVLHQVCSSDSVSPIWLNYLASFDPIILPSWAIPDTHDFRTMAASYFQLLSTFCSLAKSNIEDAQHIFSSIRFINDQVLSRSFFIQQTHAMIDSYIKTTRNDFERLSDWIKVTFNTTYMLTGTNTNFDITVSDNGTIIIKPRVYAVAYQTDDESVHFSAACMCHMVDHDCFGLAVLYSNGTSISEFQQILWEFPITCIPLDGFLSSKFTWWYNETYLKNIIATYSIVIDSQPSPDIMPLNISVHQLDLKVIGCKICSRKC